MFSFNIEATQWLVEQTTFRIADTVIFGTFNYIVGFHQGWCVHDIAIVFSTWVRRWHFFQRSIAPSLILFYESQDSVRSLQSRLASRRAFSPPYARSRPVRLKVTASVTQGHDQFNSRSRGSRQVQLTSGSRQVHLKVTANSLQVPRLLP